MLPPYLPTRRVHTHPCVTTTTTATELTRKVIHEGGVAHLPAATTRTAAAATAAVQVWGVHLEEAATCGASTTAAATTHGTARVREVEGTGGCEVATEATRASLMATT
jgi:hypothetical protein